MLCRESIVDCIPSIFILAVTAWSYYTYVVELCINTIENDKVIKISLYLIFYHLLLFMYLWTYCRVMFTDIAVVPVEYKIPRLLYESIKGTETEEEKNSLLVQFCYKQQLIVVTRNAEGRIRFCKKCKQVKPDRAHHCSTCQTCILKMDHHCPWVNNCVGFSNYKYFVLFLIYASLYCVYYAATTLEYVIKFWATSKRNLSNLHIVFAFIIAVSIAIIVTSFTFYHISLFTKNQTTLEMLTEPTFRDDSLTFNIGTMDNCLEIFGTNCLLWCIPLWSSCGDGVHFPVRLMF